VELALYKDAVFCYIISLVTSNIGVFEWEVANSVRPGGNFSVRVACTDGSFSDVSEAFEISATPQPSLAPSPSPSHVPTLTPTISPPKVSIVSPRIKTIDPSKRFELEAAVSLGVPGFQLAWNSGDVDLTNSSVVATPVDALWLVISAGALRAGHHYDMLGRPGRANMTVTANSSPIGGAISVTPRLGEALLTVFNLQTSGWSDPEDNLPLAHGYSYLSSGDTPVRLGGFSSVAGANASLPFGNVTTSVAVQGSLGAEASAVFSTAVSFDPHRDLNDAVHNAMDKIVVVPGSGRHSAGGDAQLLLPSSQDNAKSMASIASCAELLNLAGIYQARGIANAQRTRESLLSLARNCSREWHRLALGSVELRAATLEMILDEPKQVRHMSNDNSHIFWLKFNYCACKKPWIDLAP